MQKPDTTSGQSPESKIYEYGKGNTVSKHVWTLKIRLVQEPLSFPPPKKNEYGSKHWMVE